MTQRGASRPGPGRDEAVRGVEERLATTVHAYPGLRLVEIPAQFLRLPDGEPVAGHRVLRGGRLPDLGGAAADEAYDVVAELWRSAGCRVDDATGLDGRLLVVHDPAGYVLALTRHGDDDPVLTVGSPPLPARFASHGLPLGLAAGLLTGCLGPCVSSVVPVTGLPVLAGLTVTHYLWVPLFLLVAGVCLSRPDTRRFGAGLLLGGAVVGLTVAGVVAA